MRFSVGQRVRCVETWVRGDGEGYGDEIGPVAGHDYTIRHAGIGLNSEYPSHMQVRLFEIVNEERAYRCGTYEAAWRASRFRALDDRKTDISVFTEIARKASSKIGEPA